MGEPQLRYETYRVVDCHELDQFVRMHLEGFGVVWRSLETSRWDGYNNGSYVTTYVAPGRELDDEDGQDFDNWLHGGEYFPHDELLAGMPPSIDDMLQWLCNRGKLEGGSYLVRLWW